MIEQKIHSDNYQKRLASPTNINAIVRMEVEVSEHPLNSRLRVEWEHY